MKKKSKRNEKIPQAPSGWGGGGRTLKCGLNGFKKGKIVSGKGTWGGGKGLKLSTELQTDERSGDTGLLT